MKIKNILTFDLFLSENLNVNEAASPEEFKKKLETYISQQKDLLDKLFVSEVKDSAGKLNPLYFPIKGGSAILVESASIASQMEAPKSTGNGIAVRLKTTAGGTEKNIDIYLAPDPKDKKIKLFPSQNKIYDITMENITNALPPVLVKAINTGDSRWEGQKKRLFDGIKKIADTYAAIGVGG
jgi:hypothetical protein